MKKVSFYRALLILCATIFAAGCQTGGDKLASTSALTHEDTTVVRAKAPEPTGPVLREGSPGSAVTLAAARTDTVRRGPSLIKLAPGDDIQQYLDDSHRRVILDFYADWCGPCRQQGQVLREIESAASRADTLIVKINVDQHDRLARSLSIESLPTLMVWGEGRVMQRRSGLASASQILSWIETR